MEDLAAAGDGNDAGNAGASNRKRAQSKNQD